MPHLITDTIADRLKLICGEKGISGRELSRISGVHSNILSRITQGKRGPSADTLAKICAALSVSADFLLGLSDKP